MTTSTEMVKPMTDTRTTMTKVKLISYVFTHTVLYFFQLSKPSSSYLTYLCAHNPLFAFQDMMGYQ